MRNRLQILSGFLLLLTTLLVAGAGRPSASASLVLAPVEDQGWTGRKHAAIYFRPQPVAGLRELAGEGPRPAALAAGRPRHAASDGDEFTRTAGSAGRRHGRPRVCAAPPTGPPAA